jgi:DNA-binding transcriptional LysR family regulator
MPFNRDHLRYFVAVADEGQITQAARRLFMAQPALSQAISQLESELGLRLLDRHARGVTLTDAGEAFVEKARAAVASETEVRRTAESLARAERGILELGFIGPPPTMNSGRLIEAFAQARADAELSLRDLPFPTTSTRDWLEPVDVALCQTPALEADLRSHVVRTEPRVLIVPADHRLAQFEEIDVAEALDETFISYHPDVERGWSAYHSLDEQRGGPPLSQTDDHVTTALQMLGVFATTKAVTTLPRGDAEVFLPVMPNLRAVNLLGIGPATISLTWRAEDAHPLVTTLVELTRGDADDAGPTRGET